MHRFQGTATNADYREYSPISVPRMRKNDSL